jgi:ABC-2 type transport system ATP-binding protein
MIVSTDRLTKQYGSFTALEACTLAVPRGEVFGLLGPNGAGKTTLLRLLLGFISPTSGSAMVAGHDCATDSLSVRSRVAYLPGEARLSRRMTGKEVLAFFARLRPSCNLDRATRAAARLGLDTSRQVARMSTGMRQKLALATVVATDCELLILDEPTANLDPTARAEVLDIVREANTKGRTVIFSSHVLSEVEDTCHRVAIMRAGSPVFEQSIAAIRRGHRITARLAEPFTGVPASLAGHVAVVDARASGHGHARTDGQDHVTLEAADSLAPLLGWLATLRVTEIAVEPIGLAAVYDRFHRGGAT